MAKIDASTFRNWNNGETIFEADYEQEREILRTAINDNYARLIKKYEVLDSAGTLKTTQNLDTAINYLKFKETAQIVLSLDTLTSTMTIGVVDGSITTAKLANLGVTTAKIADLNVTTIKVADLAITTAKLADNAVNLLKMNLTDVDTRYYTKTLLDGGQLDTRYYTETEVDPKNTDGTANFSVNSVLDKRYYTEPEIDKKLTETAGGQAYSIRAGISFPTSPSEADIIYREDLDNAYVWAVGSDGVGYWKLVGGGSLINYKNTNTLTADATNVAIGINDFTSSTDYLIVVKNSTWLQQGQDFSINANGSSVDKLGGGTWSNGDVFDFVVLKRSNSEPSYKDGGLLADGTVTKVKLVTGVQNTLTNADNHHADTVKHVTQSDKDNISYALSLSIIGL